jgi:protein disulfide-isomerase A6
VIAVLPHISASRKSKSGREAYLDTLEGAAKQVRGKPFNFAWVQGGDQPAFEDGFELTLGYPTLVAINLDRQRNVVQRQAFTAAAIGEFLQGVLQGREPTVGFDAFPQDPDGDSVGRRGRRGRGDRHVNELECAQ